MARSLCISATFLNPIYHGRTDSGREGEWPPSPMRLFQALTAAAFGACAPHGAERDAFASSLQWLEERSQDQPPEIIAATAVAGTPCTLFVPNNDLDIVARAWAQSKPPPKEPAALKTAKVMRPHHLADPSQVHYVWTMPEAMIPPEATTLCRLARRVVVLGWGVDLVACEGRVIDDSDTHKLPGESWQPRRSTRKTCAADSVRVPVAGSLVDLKSRHSAFLGSMTGGVYTKPPATVVFNEVLYRRVTDDRPSRPFAAFVLRPVINPAVAEQGTPEGAAERRKADAFLAFRGANAAKVAAMLRHVACNAAKVPGQWPFPDDSARYVAGHGEKAKQRSPDDPSARFSYLALPSVGGPHADGMIRRMIVAEPFGGDGEHAAWAERALAGLGLVDEDSGTPVATLDRLHPSDAGERKMLARFIGPSRNWITATPVVLPGFDGLKMEKAARLFSRACDQAGLPPGSVESFEFIGPPARGDGRFFVPSYLRGLPLRWAVVRFTHEVSGPIALGAGRHCGLGVFAVDYEA